MNNKPKSKSFYVKVVKRFADIIIGLCALPFLALITLVVGIAIKLDDGGPILFKQNRITINGKIFNVLNGSVT